MKKKSLGIWVRVLVFVLFCLIMGSLLPLFALDDTIDRQTKKVVFLWSKGHHPNKEGCELFKYCLENSPNAKGIKCEIYENWPENPSTLDNAATIVIYSEGIDPEKKYDGKPHPVLTPQHMEYLDKLMKKGVGIVCIHYTLIVSRQAEAPKLLEWIGAYYDFQGYGSTHYPRQNPQPCAPVTSYHPVSRGWKEFILHENELYHNLRFSGNNFSVPILTTPFHHRQYVVAWALERKDGGHGFGYSGGHFYSEWMNEDCRRMMLNAILWTAKVEVPRDGVVSSVPDDLKNEKKQDH